MSEAMMAYPELRNPFERKPRTVEGEDLQVYRVLVSRRRDFVVLKNE